MGGRPSAAAATAISRATASNSVRRPDPGAPTSVTTACGDVPSASASSAARRARRSARRPTKTPASGSPSGYGTSSSASAADPSPESRAISRSTTRALAGRSPGSAASNRSSSRSHPAPSPGRIDDSGGGGPASVRCAAGNPCPNGGAPLQASNSVAPSPNRSVAGVRAPVSASGAAYPSVPRAPAAAGQRRPRQTEVDQHGSPGRTRLVCQADVSRRDVTVHDAARVQVRQRRRQIDRDPREAPPAAEPRRRWPSAAPAMTPARDR